MILLVYSPGLVHFLGLPETDQYFYPNILGAVLIGIGIALLFGYRGLGIYGAIAINLCGGLVLAFWLIMGNLSIPSHGRFILWMLVLILIGISIAELIASKSKGKGSARSSTGQSA